MSNEIKDKKEESSEKFKITVLDKFFEFIKDAPPLFLPIGSVRAILAIGLIVISGLLMMNGIEIQEWLYSSVVMVLGFYFGARNEKTK